MRANVGMLVQCTMLIRPLAKLCSALKLRFAFPAHFRTLVNVAMQVIGVPWSPVVVSEFVVIVQTKKSFDEF